MADSNKRLILLTFRADDRAEARQNQSVALRRDRIRRFGIDAAVFKKGRCIPGWCIAVVASACVLGAVTYRHFEGKVAFENASGSLKGTVTRQFTTMRAASGEEYLQIGRLLGRLINYDSGAASQAARSRLDLIVEKDIDTLMSEFGAEEYSAPPEFVIEVTHHVRQFQEFDHDLMARALVDERGVMDQMRPILQRQHLPEDLAYMALVESGFVQGSTSQEGAVGPWQFTEATAREYGLRVEPGADDRIDLSKSTEAAGRYIRDLILDFGSGSSVLLAMAAYNGGPEMVRRAVRNVKDPIKQRNFWYLYETRALPEETRQYVPKVFAAILIGRNPQRYGF